MTDSTTYSLRSEIDALIVQHTQPVCDPDSPDTALALYINRCLSAMERIHASRTRWSCKQKP